MKITADPRIELMSILQLLCDDLNVSRYDYAYKRDVIAHFWSYREHALTELYRKIMWEGFSFDAVPNAMLCFSEPPALIQRRSFSAYLLERAGGVEQLQHFAALLRDFAACSSFVAFYDTHQLSYTQAVQKTALAANRAIDQLRDYLGDALEHATLIPGLLLHHGGYGVLLDEEQPPQAYALIGPTGATDDQPDFGSEQYLAEICQHEFSHTVINPITSSYSHELETLSHLHPPIATVMKSQFYEDWATIINEHIIRAITARLATLHYGHEEGQALLKQEQERGFAYVARLADALRSYEHQRQRYAHIRDFYPELLAALRR